MEQRKLRTPTPVSAEVGRAGRVLDANHRRLAHLGGSRMAEGELTDYERMVRANIERNRRVLEELGLGRKDAVEHERLRNTSRKGSDRAKGVREAIRKSQRLLNAGKHDGFAPSAADGESDAARSPVSNRGMEARHSDARSEHLRWGGKQAGKSVVGTASYEHTLHRVLTMSEKQLKQRIKVIERAKGKHAVIKMKLFTTILALEGYVDIAEEARDAYQRLVQVLGEPTVDGDSGDDK